MGSRVGQVAIGQGKAREADSVRGSGKVPVSPPEVDVCVAAVRVAAGDLVAVAVPEPASVLAAAGIPAVAGVQDAAGVLAAARLAPAVGGGACRWDT